MMEIRLDYIISFVLAFTISFFFTPVAKRIAKRLGAIDVPKDERRVHSRPIARMGGLAIVVGFLVAFLYNILADILIRQNQQNILFEMEFKI